MKLRYTGLRPEITLPEIKTETQKSLIKRGDVFECNAETCAKLLRFNKQYVKPIFVDPATEDLDLLGDLGKNKMGGPTKKK